jgi:hypothetical protein
MGSWIDVLMGGVAGTALSAAVVLVFKGWILEKLKAAVSFEYQEKLEALKLEHQQLLERFREERAEREGIRSLALSSLAATQSGVLERRLQAIEVLWRSVQELRHASPSLIFVIDSIGYDARQFGRALRDWLRATNTVELLRPTQSISQRVFDLRPFIGERLYALFFGLQVAYGRATTATILSYQQGNFRKWFEDADMRTLLGAALTEDELRTFFGLQSENLDWLWRRLEEKIIQEISVIISGQNTAADNLGFARQLIAAASSVAVHEEHSENG